MEGKRLNLAHPIDSLVSNRDIRVLFQALPVTFHVFHQPYSTFCCRYLVVGFALGDQQLDDTFMAVCSCPMQGCVSFIVLNVDCLWWADGDQVIDDI